MKNREIKEYHSYNNNENKKECEGCVTNKFCVLDPSYTDPKTNETIKCPCVECIVKVTCYSLPCEEYRSYDKAMHKIKYNF